MQSVPKLQCFIFSDRKNNPKIFIEEISNNQSYFEQVEQSWSHDTS